MIDNETTYVDRPGDGIVTSFSFDPIKIFDQTQLKVYLVEAAASADEGTLLTLGSGASNYSVSVPSFPGTGSITYPASGGTPLAATHFLRIIPNVPLTQTTHLESQGGYNPGVVEQALDKFVTRIKTIYERLDRALLVPRSSEDTPSDLLADLIASGSDAADEAAASAAAAEASATAAAASAVTAATAADNLKGTSTTSVLIGSGTKVFTTQAGEAYQTGGFVMISSDAGPTNFMFGQVTTYSGTTLTVDVQVINGAGTFADWNIAISGARGPQGAAGAGTGDMIAANNLSDVANAATSRANLGLAIGTNVQAFDAELAALAGLTSAANKVPRFTGSGTAGLLDFLDEDNMASDSATAVASQQSIKAYIDGLIAGATATPTGTVIFSVNASEPTGYLFARGGTIGNASSGGTQRANADTQALFTILWNSFADAQAPVSTGRGANAAADFAANKTITLPDIRGRVVAGQDDMGGTSANRLTNPGSVGGMNGDTLGNTGGQETHVQTELELVAHTHTIAHAPDSTGTGKAEVTSDVQNGTINTGSTGGGGGFNVVQPTIILNAFIKL